jgi:hypothetical protein
VQNHYVHTCSQQPISHTQPCTRVFSHPSIHVCVLTSNLARVSYHIQPCTCVFLHPTLHVYVLTPIYARVCSRNQKHAQGMATPGVAAWSTGGGSDGGSKGGSFGAGSASKAGNALGSNKTPLAFTRPIKAAPRKGKEPANTEPEILGESRQCCGSAQPTRALPSPHKLTHALTPLRVRTRGRMHARDATP